MSLNKACLWLSALLVLGGCPGPEEEKPRLSAVEVTCTPASVVASRPAQCTPSAKDQDGNPFTVSSYRWTSSNEAVATVDATGKVATSTAGTATISASATADGITQQGQATLTVTQPIVHATSITANETWRAVDSPHIVRGSIEVTGAGAPTLTLEAGVEIRFEQDAELRITQGALRAMGTQEAPVQMVSSQSTPTKGHWRGLVFAVAGSTSELNHVTLSHCGRSSGEGACVALKNQAAPVLRQVKVQNSGTMGVMVADSSAFGVGSTALSVSGSEGYAIHISANQAGTLPTGGSFTSNTLNAVELRGNVSSSQTWPNPGIPYVVNHLLNVESSAGPTLTLAAGTAVRFGPDAGLLVGPDLPGELIVDGTAAAPVFLTANATQPQPGHWRGVHLMSGSSGTSRISHATIEYAGATGSIGTGNLNIYGNGRGGGARPVTNNLVVQKGSAYGVYLLESGSFGTGSFMLSARDNGNYAVSVEANYVGTLPTGGSFTGNVPNAVEIRCCNVVTTQTWPNLGIPYVINANIDVVGSSSATTLTVPAGTVVQFGQDLALRIGNETQPGSLVAKGTAAEPIRFIPAGSTPAKGHWRGLHFWNAAGSELDHVTVTHSGATGSIGMGNVNVYREIGAFMTNSTLSDSSGCGVTVSNGTRPNTTTVTTNFTLATYNNTLANNTAGTQCIN